MTIKKIRHILPLALACLLMITGPTVQASAAPTITLIIDDIGYNLRNGQRAVNLPGAVNYAVLPHTPYSQRLAREAHKKGKVVMLHAPMSNIHQRNPGPGTLSPVMNRESFDAELEKALADIPFVQGVNNHMGSELTQDKERMQWLMDTVRKHRMFFIDSRTTAQSVAAETAREEGIPSMTRDIFLDHIRTPEAVSEAFDDLIRKAKRSGHAVAIGHPHRVTLDVLEARLPELKAAGIRLISVQEQLVAMGQVYPDRQPEFAAPSPEPSPLLSPLFWQNEIQQLTRYQADNLTHPKIIRRSVIERRRDALDHPEAKPAIKERRKPGIITPEPRSERVFPTTVKPATDGGRDISKPPARQPHVLQPINKNPQGSPRETMPQRRLPEVTAPLNR